MSRQEDLKDMHALLQQMRDMQGYDVPEHCEGILNRISQYGNKVGGNVTEQDILEYYFANDSTTTRNAIGTSEVNKDSTLTIDMNDNSQKGLLIKYCSITKQKNVLYIVKSKHPGEHNMKAENAHDSDKDKMIHLLKLVTQPDIIKSIFNALVEISACRTEMTTNWAIPRDDIKNIIDGNRHQENEDKKAANKGKSWSDRLRGK